MSSKNIFVKGAREHNLKNIDLEIPRDQLVVFTGLSGSGKSSLAFDTIYAESFFKNYKHNADCNPEKSHFTHIAEKSHNRIKKRAFKCVLNKFKNRGVK